MWRLVYRVVHCGQPVCMHIAGPVVPVTPRSETVPELCVYVVHSNVACMQMVTVVVYVCAPPKSAVARQRTNTAVSVIRSRLCSTVSLLVCIALHITVACWPGVCQYVCVWILVYNVQVMRHQCKQATHSRQLTSTHTLVVAHLSGDKA